MSLVDCIIKGSDQGIISAEKQMDMINDFDINKEKYLKLGMSEGAAERQAGIDTFDKVKYDKARKIQIATINAKKQAAFNYQIENSGMNPGEVMERFFGQMEVREGLKFINSVEDQIYFFRAIAQKEFGKILFEFNQTWTGGVKNKAGQMQMVREIVEPGTTKNKSAQELALAWTRTSELLRKMFNERGGNIPKMEGNYLPQFHDKDLIAAVDFETWRDFILPRLDLERMINYRTGQAFSPEALELALAKSYDGIIFEGANKPSVHQGYGAAMYNKRIDHRFFHFKSADAWQEYNAKFGGDSSPFDIMVGHFETMTRDIGMMDVLGANPDAMVRWMGSRVKQLQRLEIKKMSAKDFKKYENKMNQHINSAEAMHMYLKGSLHAPVNKGIAVTMASLRGVQTVTKLGSAPVLALGDVNFARTTAAFAGLPQARFMASHVRQIMTLPGSEWRKIAATSDVVADSYMNVSSSSARFTADMTEQTEVMRRVTDASLKGSGLNWQTQGGKNAAGLEFMAQLERLPSNFDKLPKHFQDYLEMNGIGKDAWRIIKETEPWEAKPGAKFLQPSDILNRSDLSKEVAEDLSKKLMMATRRFVAFAVPEVNAKSATSGLIVGLGKTKSGTAEGEVMRMILQFKQFPMTFHHTHIMRGLTRHGLSGKAKYLVPLVISTTLMGALAFELKQVLKGKDTTTVEGLTDPKYWLNAMIHGGGLGYYGDLLFGTRYSAASGLAGVLGATPAMLFDILGLTTGNIYEGISKDKDMNIGADLSSFMRKHTPGSSHWYLRLAMERLIFDTLQKMIDPKWNRKKKQKIKRTKKLQNTDFWWRPGDIMPDRPPSFFNK